MESRLNDMRILGMPVQFVVVVVVSLALTIYFGAWAADARINARATGQTVQQFDFRPGASSSGGAGLAGGLGKETSDSSSGAAEAQAWENMFLFACPLH